MRSSGRRGGTLLELVLYLGIGAVISLFGAEFLRGQADAWGRYERKTQAARLAGAAYFRLEEELRYGCDFYVRPGSEERLYFRLRTQEGQKSIDGSGLSLRETKGLTLRISFYDTVREEARAEIRVMDGETLLYTQDAVFPSMYDYAGMEGDERNE